MSLLTQAGLLALDQVIDDVLIRSSRSIAGIIPQVVIQEHHRDELQITEHPVEQGAAITDHAFSIPSSCTMRCGWSDSGSLLSIGTGISDPDSAYSMLLSLQASRQPFDVLTGKRTYSNMLIKSLDVITDASTENALIIEIELKQILIAQTMTTTLPPSANMASPEQTAPTANAGTKQPQAVPSSVLFQGAQFLGLGG